MFLSISFIAFASLQYSVSIYESATRCRLASESSRVRAS